MFEYFTITSYLLKFPNAFELSHHGHARVFWENTDYGFRNTEPTEKVCCLDSRMRNLAIFQLGSWQLCFGFRKIQYLWAFQVRVSEVKWLVKTTQPSHSKSRMPPQGSDSLQSSPPAHVKQWEHQHPYLEAHKNTDHRCLFWSIGSGTEGKAMNAKILMYSNRFSGNTGAAGLKTTCCEKYLLIEVWSQQASPRSSQNCSISGLPE